jgi:ribokinase
VSGIAIVGYASLDHVLRLEDTPRPDATAIATRTGDDWPRLGGSPSYIAAALVRAGVARAVPITWVADDESGARFVEALVALGVTTAGVARSLPGATPVCVLAYAPEGACFCLYAPGASRAAGLDDTQRRLLDAADWVCVTAGPAEATREVLARLRPAQRLAWAVKADADAFPPPLRSALAIRADLIVFSCGERPFVAAALEAAPLRRERLVVETQGTEGARLSQEGHSEQIAATAPVQTPDPTGAGDTFVGGMLAALLADPEDAAAAVRLGQRAAGDMLRARVEGTTP